MSNEFLEHNGQTLQGLTPSCRLPLQVKLSQCVRSPLRFRNEMVIQRFDTKMRLITLKTARGTGRELMEPIRIGLREVIAQGHPCGFMHVYSATRREILDHRQCTQLAEGTFASFLVQPRAAARIFASNQCGIAAASTTRRSSILLCWPAPHPT